jgi:hypothetical protein
MKNLHRGWWQENEGTRNASAAARAAVEKSSDIRSPDDVGASRYRADKRRSAFAGNPVQIRT